jgi:hypothetical protein
MRVESMRVDASGCDAGWTAVGGEAWCGNDSIIDAEGGRAAASSSGEYLPKRCHDFHEEGTPDCGMSVGVILFTRAGSPKQKQKQTVTRCMRRSQLVRRVRRVRRVQKIDLRLAGGIVRR